MTANTGSNPMSDDRKELIQRLRERYGFEFHLTTNGVAEPTQYDLSMHPLVAEAIAELSAQPSPDAAQCKCLLSRVSSRAPGICDTCKQPLRGSQPDAAQGSAHGGEGPHGVEAGTEVLIPQNLIDQIRDETSKCHSITGKIRLGAKMAIAWDRQNRAPQPVQDAPVVPDLQAWDDSEIGLYVKNALDSSTSIDQCGRVMRRFISSMYPQPAQAVAESVVDERFEALLAAVIERTMILTGTYNGTSQERVREEKTAHVKAMEALRIFFKQSRQSPRAGMVSVLKEDLARLLQISIRTVVLDRDEIILKRLESNLSHSSKGDERGNG